MENHIVVYCVLSDCVSYRPEPSNPRKCRCVHPEKSHYLNREICPLYRMDWQKKMKQMQSSSPPPAPRKPPVDF